MCRKSTSKKTLLLFSIVLSLIAGISFGQRMVDFDIGQSDLIAPPRLIEPSVDVIDLTNKDYLEFKWSPHEGEQIKREYYDFRLYRGYQMIESALIFKARIPPRQWSLKLKASIFKNGQVYTWSLRQVYTGVKSRRSFDSFKVLVNS
ncbi:MAG: hypothetical protein NC938_01305 [Candidatus Omnitrophica bacterium]|nr:hypothetical protein [Candidatus Omnitrophota bacterium]